VRQVAAVLAGRERIRLARTAAMGLMAAQLPSLLRPSARAEKAKARQEA